MKRSISLIFSAGIFIALVVCSCGPKTPECNKYNPSTPCYERPALTLTSPVNDNGVLANDTLRVSWAGNSPYSEYRWRIDTLA